LGGVAASAGHVGLVPVCAIVVAAAIIGDSVGYEVGRHFGPRLVRVRILQRHQKRLGDAQAFLARRGGSAVFLGRFVAFFRAVMPALAGSAHMPYRRFLAYNAAGGLVWGISFVLIGFVAGNSYARIEQAVGRGAAIVVAVVVITALIVRRARRGRRERADEKQPP
jgi:membrane-associated protein